MRASYNSVTSNLASASPAARWERHWTPWGQRLAIEDAARREYLNAKCRTMGGFTQRKTHVGDVYGALRVVEHLPKQDTRCMVLCECERGHRVAMRSEQLRSMGQRQVCRHCRKGARRIG